MSDENATTEYGTWSNYTNYDQPADGIREFLGDQGDQYDVAAIVSDYVDAINDALPTRVGLAGNTIYGPYPMPDDAAEQIDAALDAVDLAGIVARHERGGFGE